jgi:hypothetical protein
MHSHRPTLELLRKLGELRSDSYEIDWDKWEDMDDTDLLIESVNQGITDYESKFTELANSIDFYKEEVNENQVHELEEIIDALIQGYLIQTLIGKKKAIEDFISTV